MGTQFAAGDAVPSPGTYYLYAGTAGCNDEVEYVVNQSSILSITVTPTGGCNDNGTPGNPNDDFFTVDVTVTYVNPPATGNLELIYNGNLPAIATVGVGAIGPASHTFTGVELAANGTFYSLRANFTVDPACTLLAPPFTAPPACSNCGGFSTTGNATAPTCDGDLNGTITLSPSGGTPTYSYTYTGPTNGSGTGLTINGLGAGSYTIDLTDGNGCTATVVVVVPAGNPNPVANTPATPIAICYTLIPPFVDVAALTALLNQVQSEITGGAPGATVSWWFNANGTGPINFFSLPNLITLATGPQPVTIYASVTAGGCTSAIIPVTGSVSLTPTASPAQVQACAGASGQATFDLNTVLATVLNGQTGTVNFFSDPAGNTPINNPGAYVSGAGTVYASVENNGCNSALVPITLTLTPSFTASDAFITVSPTSFCGSGQVTVTLTTPASPAGNYTFDFSYGPVGGPYTPITLVGQTGQSPLSVNISESHEFIVSGVTGPDGCVVSYTPAQVVLVSVSPGADLNPIPDVAACDSYTLPPISGPSVGPGAAYYTQPGGGGVVFQPGDVITATTTLYAFDGAPGCSDEESFTITITPVPPPAPASLSACADASLGGDASFDLTSLENLVSGGSGLAVNWYTDPAGNNPINNPGAYLSGSAEVYATLTDGGCESITVPISLLVTAAPQLDPVMDVSVCASYTLPGITGQGLVSPAYYTQPAGAGPALAPGQAITTTTILYIYDENAAGCNTELSFVVNIGNGPTLSCSQQSPASAPGAADGEAAIVITGGAPGYTLSYTGPTSGTQTAGSAGTALIPNLPAGSYNLTVTDADGCTSSCSFVINDASCVLNVIINSSGISPCFGAVNGVVVTEVFDAVGTVTYDWNVDALDGTPSPDLLPAGFYEVTVSDATGCVATASVTLSTPPYMIDSCVVLNPASGPMATDGGARVYFDHGLPDYTLIIRQEFGAYIDTLTLTDAAGSVIFNDLPPGYYFVELTDANNCVAGCGFLICGSIDYTLTGTDESCAGQNDASATLIPVGAYQPYQYLWSTTDTSAIIDSLPPGRYYITITDDLGCTRTDSIDLGAATLLELSCGQPTPSSGAADGTGQATITGGSPGYTLILAGPVADTLNQDTAGVALFGGLLPGDYTLTALDTNGCVATCMFTVAVGCNVQLACAQSLAESAPGAADGVALLTITGGSSPYQVAYTGPITGAVSNVVAAGPLPVSGLTAGDYNFVVTDANGCTVSCDLTISVNVCGLALDIQGVNPTCNTATDGAIALTATGGVGMLTFNWNVDALDGTEDPANLGAGFYQVTVTDENACTAVAEVTLAEPPALNLSCAELNPVSGPGLNDGAAQINFSGGTAPYTLAITGPLNLNLPAAIPSNTVVPNLPAGNYNLVLTDNNGCTLACSFTIGDGACDLSIATSSTPVSCSGGADGTATVMINGGTGPYQISWSNLDDTSSITNLTAGAYFVTVTDAGGCLATSSVVVAPGALLPNLTVGAASTICVGDCYNLPLSFSGALPATIDYTLTTGAGSQTLSVSSQISADLSLTICAADFALTDTLVVEFLQVTGNGCSRDLTGLRRVFIREQPASSTLNPTLCAGESLQVGADLYDIANPSGTTVLTNGASNGCDSVVTVQLSFYPTASAALSQDICVGESVVVGSEVFDANRLSGTVVLPAAAVGGCDSTVSVTLTLLSQPGFTLVETLCPGESRVVNGTTYDVTNPTGTEILPGAGANGCDSVVTVNLSFRPAAMSAFNETLCVGETRTIGGMVFDEANPVGDVLLPGAAAGGCDSTVFVQLTFLPASATNLNLTLCADEQVQVGAEIFDATRPSGMVTLANALGCDSVVTVNLTFLPAGSSVFTAEVCVGETVTLGGQVFDQNNPTGLVVLTDANGCDSTVTVNLTFLPAALGSVVQTLCAGESLTVGGVVFSAANPQGVVVLPGASSLGCDSTVMVNLTFLPALSVTLSGDAAICAGESTQLTITPTPGASFDLVLGNGVDPDLSLTAVNQITTLAVSPSVSSAYNWVSAVASNSTCPVDVLGQANVQVSNLQITAAATSDYAGFAVSCPENADGVALATAQNGIAPYVFAWSNGATGAQAEGLQADVVYQVTVTDAGGCSDTSSILLTAPLAISAQAVGLNGACFGGVDGAILLENLAGGSGGGYEYSLDGQFFAPVGELPFRIPDLAPGSYQLQIQDANDCRTSVQVLVQDGVELTLVLNDDERIQLGDSVALSPLTNFEPAAWEWTPRLGLSKPDSLSTFAAPLETTTYQLSLRDINGCVVSARVRVIVDTEAPIYIPNAFSPDGNGVNDRLLVFAGPGVVQVRQFMVFDRWGDQLFVDGPFQPNDPAHGWDGQFQGQPMNAGVYVYYAEVELINGEVVRLKGDVVLLR